jgi:hypothetical protein
MKTGMKTRKRKGEKKGDRTSQRKTHQIKVSVYCLLDACVGEIGGAVC